MENDNKSFRIHQGLPRPFKVFRSVDTETHRARCAPRKLSSFKYVSQEARISKEERFSVRIELPAFLKAQRDNHHVTYYHTSPKVTTYWFAAQLFISWLALVSSSRSESGSCIKLGVQHSASLLCPHIWFQFPVGQSPYRQIDIVPTRNWERRVQILKPAAQLSIRFWFVGELMRRDNWVIWGNGSPFSTKKDVRGEFDPKNEGLRC